MPFRNPTSLSVGVRYRVLRCAVAPGQLGDLHLRRDERIREDVQRLVQIRTRVIRSNAGTETNPIFGDGRIIDWGNPKTAAAKIVAQPAHPVAIADHKRHNISGRLTRIDPERV